MSGRDEAGRGATRQAGIGRALPTGWSERDEVGRGPPGPRLVPGPAPRSQLYLWITSKSAAGVRPVAVLRGSSCRSFTEDSGYDFLQVRR
jgi:hypothetical protein